MIESVEIKNYKVIDYLKVENLTNINFFVGKNNCGKTSLLEAIFLNFQPTNSQLIFKVVSISIRHISPSNENLEWFFYKMNTRKQIEIVSTYNGKKMCLKIKPKFSNNFSFKIQDNTNEQDLNNIQQEKMRGLDFEVQFNGEKNDEKCDKKDKQKVNFDVVIENKGAQHEIIGGVIPNYKSFSGRFIPSGDIGFNNAISVVAEIRKLKKENDLNKYLRIFDEKISDIEVIGNDVMLDIADIPKRVSINVMGEGFKKYFLIVSALILNKQQYICIDEIENGLHFESMEKLIFSIIELSRIAKIQLFVSTHSYEFLEILEKVTSNQNYNNVAVFNLAHTKLKGLQTYRYNMIDLKNLLKTKSEFRD